LRNQRDERREGIPGAGPAVNQQGHLPVRLARLNGVDLLPVYRVNRHGNQPYLSDTSLDSSLKSFRNGWHKFTVSLVLRVCLSIWLACQMLRLHFSMLLEEVQ
jgi:hypothetical protein